jgi:peptide/nickel transport system permease protein
MRFLLRRLGFFVLTFWAAMTVNFFIPRLMPGDPALAMMGKFKGHINAATLNALEAQFGTSKQSIGTQYLEYLRNTLTGHLGASLTNGFPIPVTTMIKQSMWWTIGLIGVTTVLAFVLGTVIGIVAGWRRGGVLDSVLPPVFVVTSALPFFWVGMMLILVFSVWHWPHAIQHTGQLLPNDGTSNQGAKAGFTFTYIRDVLRHAILPAAALVVTAIGGWILTMRNNMITTLAEDYVRMGRAKGLSNNRIMYNYAARNAILPNLSGFAMSLGFVISGAILIEVTFNYPGLGYLLLNAVNNEDFPLMQGLFLLITVAVLVSVLLCDFVTAWLDPRARAKA